MTSYKNGDVVRFVANRGPEKGNMITGKVLRTKSMGSGCVGCFIEGLDGFDHGFVPLPQIQPFSDISNPAEHRECYLEIGGYAIYAVDLKSGQQIATVTINGGFQKAFQLIESAVAAKGCYRIIGG